MVARNSIVYPPTCYSSNSHNALIIKYLPPPPSHQSIRTQPLIDNQLVSQFLFIFYTLSTIVLFLVDKMCSAPFGFAKHEWQNCCSISSEPNSINNKGVTDSRNSEGGICYPDPNRPISISIRQVLTTDFNLRKQPIN